MERRRWQNGQMTPPPPPHPPSDVMRHVMATSLRSNGQTQRVANTKLSLLVRTVATGNDPRTSYSSSITRATPFFPSFPRKGQSRLVNTRTVPSPTASDQRGWGIGAGGYGTENTPQCGRKQWRPCPQIVPGCMCVRHIWCCRLG